MANGAVEFTLSKKMGFHRSVIVALLTICVGALCCPCSFPVNDESEKSRIDSFFDSNENLRVCTSAKMISILSKTKVRWSEWRMSIMETPPNPVPTQLTAMNCHIFWNVTEKRSNKNEISRLNIPILFPDQCPQECQQGIPVISFSERELNGLFECETLSSYSECLSKFPELNKLSCTLDFASHLWTSRDLFQAVMFRLSWRRWLECSEHLTSRLHNINIQYSSLTRTSRNDTNMSLSFNHYKDLKEQMNIRRSVFLVIIWIGSAPKYHIIRQQMETIMKFPSNSSTFLPEKSLEIIPWGATNEIYPCRPNSMKCHASNRRYGGLLTQSAVNFMPPGWACAQRRPLRALSHVLSLLDPKYVVLLDDDSAFNLPKFIAQFVPHVQNHVSGFNEEPVIVGEMLGRTGDKGHLSKLSLFVGGSGYILNAPLLKILHERRMPLHNGAALKQSFKKYSNTMYDNISSNSWVVDDKLSMRESLVGSDDHWRLLSVLSEGLEVSHLSASTCSNCIQIDSQSRPNINQQNLGSFSNQRESFSLEVRLIDFCANLMAHEHTCQHSDHSIGRCMLYAAQALPVNAVCMDYNKYPELSTSVQSLPFWTKGIYQTHGLVDGISGMCFTAPTCDSQRQLTCHRYVFKEYVDNEWSAIQLHPNSNSKHGYYREYTSVRNGTALYT